MAQPVHRQWDADGMKRIGAAALRVEKLHPQAPRKDTEEARPDPSAAVFMLQSPACDGCAAAAKQMTPFFSTKDGEEPPGYRYWLPQAETTIVHMAFGSPTANFYPAGAMVLCSRGPGGHWIITSGTDAVTLPNMAGAKQRKITHYRPGMVFDTGIAISSKEHGYARVAQYQQSYAGRSLEPSINGSEGWGNGYSYPVWLGRFVVLTGGIYPQITPLTFDSAVAAQSPAEPDDIMPGKITEADKKSPSRVSPCVAMGDTDMAMARVVYTEFDGIDANGDELDDALLEKLELEDGRPSFGQRWLPHSDGTLHLGIRAIEYFWWEIKTDPWVEKEFNINVMHPSHPDHGSIPADDLDAYNRLNGPNGWYGPVKAQAGYVPGWWWRGWQDYRNYNYWGWYDWGGWNYYWDGVPVWVEGYYYDFRHFQEYADTYPNVQMDLWADPCTHESLHIPITEDPPANRSKFFIAPHGYWLNPNWSGWEWLSQYKYSEGYWQPGNSFGYWGPFGNSGYWGGLWGGWPPIDGTWTKTTSTPPPPNQCTTIIKRGRYGWLVWDYGWAIMQNSLDAEEETVVVQGRMSSGSREVVYDSQLPDPS